METIAAFIPRKIGSRDQKAMDQGVKTPPHYSAKIIATSVLYIPHQIQKIADTATKIQTYITKKLSLLGETHPDGTKIFISHGRSEQWREIKDFLQDRLELECDEFNRAATAGFTITERLQEMIDDACFAVIIMTGEDKQEDQSFHARENVIHEAGLFQGALGFKKAIILLEEDCAEFSNIHGQNFPKTS